MCPYEVDDLLLSNVPCFSGTFVMMYVRHKNKKEQKQQKGKLVHWQWKSSQPPLFSGFINLHKKTYLGVFV